ncbi:MAG: aminopeptidase P family protein [Saprospiraceae bacterium]|nr:aminopeptidase P family protein [Bacteroidia bacterium]NNE13731.1 aminopeptidase P family protein [Saprospiraceae bacterium]NNL91809.1 aminopeptidase P family protein [Saprospiraceae bacterium]
MSASTFPFSAETYTSRREQLMKTLQSGKVLLLGNSNSSVNYEDNYYPFRQDSSFLYYIGLNQPGLNAVIDVDKGETILFGDDISMDHIVWMGDQEKLADLAAKAGIEKVVPSVEVFDYVDKATMYLPPYRSAHTIKLEQYLDIKELNPSLKLILAIIDQRNIKSQEEITYLHKAAGLTAKMHETIMANAKAGMSEYELVGLASKFAFDNDARWSFTPIMTTNGQTLHNHNYHNILQDGDLLLFDGGIEHSSGYAGDMTRAYPVSKTFSDKQKDIYNIVKAALDVSVEASKPGVYYKDVHLLAGLEIAKGLTELGLMKGDPEAAVDDGAQALFFPHGLGHMIGLDVHDMENLGENFVGYDETIRRSTEFGLKSLRLGRPLKNGNAITIEPGIYFIPQLIDQWASEGLHSEFLNYDAIKAYKDFGGIRIENDYIIDQNGAQLLGDPLVYDVDGVEAVRAKS